MEYKVGMTLTQGDEKVLITRQVNSTSMFERPDGTCYLLEELYLETLNQDGKIGFVQLSQHQTDFVKDADIKIKGPAPLPWR